MVKSVVPFQNSTHILFNNFETLLSELAFKYQLVLVAFMSLEQTPISFSFQPAWWVYRSGAVRWVSTVEKSQCDYACSNQSIFQTHLKMHSGEKSNLPQMSLPVGRSEQANCCPVYYTLSLSGFFALPFSKILKELYHSWASKSLSIILYALPAFSSRRFLTLNWIKVKLGFIENFKGAISFF